MKKNIPGKTPKIRLTIAVTGSSGMIYALRMLRYCLSNGFEIDLVISDAAKTTLKLESKINLEKTPVRDCLRGLYGPETDRGKLTVLDNNNIAASISSGSVRRTGMVVIPCSMKSLAGIACGYGNTLIERAADVTLKEGFKLIVVPRETPLNMIHLENMLRLARAGGLILPAMPAFYPSPESFDDLADFIVGRALDLLGIQHHDLYRSWGKQPVTRKPTNTS